MPGKKPRPPQQLDLFGETPTRAKPPRLAPTPPPAPESPVRESGPTAAEREVVSSLTDAALLETVGSGSMRLRLAAIEEVGRRRSAGAIPALARVCRLFMGYGADEMIPEQIAAVEVIAAIGGHCAAPAIAEIIDEQVIVGPGLVQALDAAAQLGSRLAHDVLLSLLRSDDAAVRAASCRLVRGRPEEVAQLRLMLADRSPLARLAAACRLGSLGHEEARPALLAAAALSPTLEVIEGLAGVIDADTVVSLGRVARLAPEWRGAILEVLEDCELPSAAKVAAGLRAAVGLRHVHALVPGLLHDAGEPGAERRPLWLTTLPAVSMARIGAELGYRTKAGSQVQHLLGYERR